MRELLSVETTIALHKLSDKAKRAYMRDELALASALQLVGLPHEYQDRILTAVVDTSPEDVSRLIAVMQHEMVADAKRIETEEYLFSLVTESARQAYRQAKMSPANLYQLARLPVHEQIPSMILYAIIEDDKTFKKTISQRSKNHGFPLLAVVVPKQKKD